MLGNSYTSLLYFPTAGVLTVLHFWAMSQDLLPYLSGGELLHHQLAAVRWLISLRSIKMNSILSDESEEDRQVRGCPRPTTQQNEYWDNTTARIIE